MVGVDLLGLTKFLDLSGLNALPAFCTIALMPYLYGIDRALIAGLAAHAILRVLGKLMPDESLAA